MRQVRYNAPHPMNDLAGQLVLAMMAKKNEMETIMLQRLNHLTSICYLCDAMTRGMNGHTNQIDMVNKYTLLF